MRGLIVMIIGMLIIDSHCAWQASSTQETLLKSFKVQLSDTTTTFEKVVVDFIEDSSGNVYEFGRLQNTDKSFVRKVDPLGDELWTGYYDGIFVHPSSNKLISAEASLAMWSSKSDGVFYGIILSASNGSVTSSRYWSAVEMKSFSSFSSDTPQCGFSPSGNYMWSTVFQPSDSDAPKLIRLDLNNPAYDYETSKVNSNIGTYKGVSHVALNDTNLISSAIVYNGNMDGAIAVHSVEWGATPTKNWSIMYSNEVRTDIQNNKMILNSDKSELVIVSPSGNLEILVFILATSSGNIIKKGRATGGFTSPPRINSITLIDDSILYAIVRDLTANDCSILIIDISTMAGTAYTDGSSFTPYYGMSSQLINGLIYFSGADTSTKEYGVIKFNSTFPSALENFFVIDSSITISEIIDTSYTLSGYSITYGGIQSYVNDNFVLTLDSESSSKSDDKSIVFNIWSSATNAAVVANTVGGTLSVEYTCYSTMGDGLINVPTITYTLVDGTDGVLDWISIDSSTAEITYSSPDLNSTYSFAIRATVNGDSAVYYDTTVSLTVTGVSSDNGNGGDGGDDGDEDNGDSSSDEKGCLSGGSKGAWGGIIAGIILVSLIGIGLIGGVIFVWIKKSLARARNNGGRVSQIHQVENEQLQTDQPISK